MFHSDSVLKKIPLTTLAYAAMSTTKNINMFMFTSANFTSCKGFSLSGTIFKSNCVEYNFGNVLHLYKIELYAAHHMYEPNSYSLHLSFKMNGQSQ